MRGARDEAALAALQGFTLPGDTLASHRRSPWSATAVAAQHLKGSEGRPAPGRAAPGEVQGTGRAGRWAVRSEHLAGRTGRLPRFAQ